MSHLARLVNAPPPKARITWLFAVRGADGVWERAKLTRAERVLSYRNKAATKRALAARLGVDPSRIRVADKEWTYGAVPAGLCHLCWVDEGKRSLGRTIAVLRASKGRLTGHVADLCEEHSRSLLADPRALFL